MVYPHSKLVATFLISFLPLFAAAKKFDKKAHYIDHLTEVNKQWSKHTDLAPDKMIAFHSDAERIQAHLNLVHEYLSNNTPAGLTRQQQAHRSDLIHVLKKYAARKKFPTNLYHASRRPYFVDHFGVHCAVGYLIEASGHHDLVAAIRKEYNYDYIADITANGLKT